MVKNIIRNLLLGKGRLQPFWEKLHRLSLYGMNIGAGCSIDNSGELWLLKFLGKHLPSDRRSIVFDVGANVGRYAAAVVERLGNRVQVYCFEPSKRTYELLTANLSDFSESVKLFNFGFGDKKECATLYSNLEGSGLASVYKRRLDHFDISMKAQEKIRLLTLDDFCRDEGIRHVDLLKLDVEGHELKVLEGAQSLISSNSVSFIQFEFGGCNIDSRTYFQDFFYRLNPRYRIYRVLLNGLWPINTYRETDEIFRTTNYLAISRKI